MKVQIIQAGFTKEWFNEAWVKKDKYSYVPKEGVNYYDPNKVEFWDQGYLEVDTFDEEKCWDLLNWSCYQENKPEELTGTAMTHCNSDIILHPKGGKYYVAKSVGWAAVSTLTKAKAILKEHAFHLWTLEDYKIK